MDLNQTSDQMEMFDFTAEGAQQEADKFVEEAGDLETDISNAASSLVPFYDSGVNISNVVQEYRKPEQERDYEYIKDQFREAGQSAAIESGLLLMGGVAGKYGAKGIKALADKVKQYEIDPTAMSAFGAGAIRKKGDNNIISFTEKKELKKLKDFRTDLISSIRDKTKVRQDFVEELDSAGIYGNYKPGVTVKGKTDKGDKPFTVEGLDVAKVKLNDPILKGMEERLGFKFRYIEKDGEYFVPKLRISSSDGMESTVYLDAVKAADYPIMGGPKGVVSKSPTIKQRFTLDDFGYKEDNPVTKGFGGSEDWLSGKIKEANKSKNLLDGATTAFLGTNKDKPLFLDTDFISSLKGARGEVRKKGEPQYDRLKKTVDKEGFDPNTTILIEVNHKGEAYIIEGNTRATLAKELGVPNIKAEIRYKNGAELVDSPFSPQNILEKSSTVRKFNKGGAVMNDQMEMAFMQEGGIADDGMDVDPVSGNEVPPGSLAEEVRDDIPAQLSEGEYVVPADVVRYYGVKFFEDLRDQAKMGLAQMEADGRIGGEPVPDGGPVNDKELSEQEMAAIREVMGMAEGGEVQNPYLQQQQLYSQPRPAPIDEKRNTTITGINPVENQMPMQSMASGGQVQGYQEGGAEITTTPAPAINTFDPGQYGLGFSFMGNQPQQQPPVADTPATPETMTLYGPNGEIRTFNMPLSEADAAEVARLKELGYTTTKSATPIPTPTTTGGGGGSTTQVESDPNSWMEKFDYTDMSNLGSQTSEILNKSPKGSVIGAFMNGTNAAQAAANIIIMDANGASKEEVAKLKSQYQQFLKDSKLEYMPKGLINGDRLAKDIVENNIDVALFKDSTDPFGNRIFKEGTNDFEKFVQKVGPKGRGSKGIQDTIAATSAPPPRPAPTGTGVSITPPTDTKRKSLDVRKAEAQTRIDAKKRRDKRKKNIEKARSITKGKAKITGKGAKAVSATQKAGPFNKGGLMNKKGDK